MSGDASAIRPGDPVPHAALGLPDNGALELEIQDVSGDELGELPPSSAPSLGMQSKSNLDSHHHSIDMGPLDDDTAAPKLPPLTTAPLVEDDWSEAMCRICQEGTDEGKLIAPCACSGSIRYIHEACLERWISHQINEGHEPRCEICHSPFYIKKHTTWSKELTSRLFLLSIAALTATGIIALGAMVIIDVFLDTLAWLEDDGVVYLIVAVLLLVLVLLCYVYTYFRILRWLYLHWKYYRLTHTQVTFAFADRPAGG